MEIARGPDDINGWSEKGSIEHSGEQNTREALFSLPSSSPNLTPIPDRKPVSKTVSRPSIHAADRHQPCHDE